MGIEPSPPYGGGPDMHEPMSHTDRRESLMRGVYALTTAPVRGSTKKGTRGWLTPYGQAAESVVCVLGTTFLASLLTKTVPVMLRPATQKAVPVPGL